MRSGRVLCLSVRQYSNTPYSEVVAKQAGQKTPSFDQIVGKWKEYPSVVAQLQQINNVFADLQKDSKWSDIEKQFKHDPNARSIDWAYLEENLKHPEIVAAYKDALETIKFQDVEIDSHFAELDKITEEFSNEVRAQNAKYMDLLPGLERDMARTESFKANIRTITIEEERAHEPKIFAEIDNELEQYMWDDEPVDSSSSGGISSEKH